jgi:isoleucyl-tRNA synthetase
MFQPVDLAFNVPELELEIIEFWLSHGIEAKYLHRNANSPEVWSFLDGPITANGPMGVHHAWGRTYKDLWQRYHTMLGHRQRYQNGFDCQGLWVEVSVERELGFTSKRDIEKYGIAPFVRKCKQSAYDWAGRQTRQSKRLGMFMDWDNSYYTLSDENNYTIWHFLKTCHQRGWLYKGTDVMPWCVRCGTGLSEHEINTTEYEQLSHTAVYVKFPLLNRPGESLLVWTTTPWTLSGNVAAAVNPSVDPVTGEAVVYVRARWQGETLYLSKNSLDNLKLPLEVEAELAGSALVGWRYHGPFDELDVQMGITHEVIPWEDVSASEGTGIVHIAPGSGKEDFQLGKQHHLRAIAPLDENGEYGEGFGWLSGRRVLDVAPDIVEDLRTKGILVRAEEYSHRYPVCWRCGTQLVFRLVDEWFISMDELRQSMMDVARRIRWIPSWGLERELDWLRNMDDWMISKKRYWGLALPIFPCGCGAIEVLGGKEELFDRAVEGLGDLESPHRPWLDDVKIKCSSCGELVARIKDVGNPWLDAGIVPFSTLEYTQNRQYWNTWFPAEFISENLAGQFRNWFYSLIAQSTALENANPFKTVLGYASVRDARGDEMHKSKGNSIEFDYAANLAGADTMRWLFANAEPETNLHFGFEMLDAVKARLLTLWNSYSFFVTYANLDQFAPGVESIDAGSRPVLDRWVLARLHETIRDVRSGLDDYNAAVAARSIYSFIEDLSTWYIRRSRRRFWKSGAASDDGDKSSAYQTLYASLHTLTQLLAPFIPHIAEHMYRNLDQARGPESVHLCDFPRCDESLINEKSLAGMDTARRLVALGRAAREQAQIRTRQPLSTVHVAVPAQRSEDLSPEFVAIILDELNVKELVHTTDEGSFVDYRVRPNLPRLGPRFGKAIPKLAAELSRLPEDMVRAARRGESIAMTINEETHTLSPDDLLIDATRREGFSALEDSGYLVALDTNTTPELVREGLARDLARAVNELRKSSGLRVEDRIRVRYSHATPEFHGSIATHKEFLMQETLAQSWDEGLDDAESIVQVEGESVRVSIARD